MTSKKTSSGRPRNVTVRLVKRWGRKYFRTFTSKGILIPPDERERHECGQDCRFEISLGSKEANILLERGVVEKVGTNEVETPAEDLGSQELPGDPETAGAQALDS